MLLPFLLFRDIVIQRGHSLWCSEEFSPLTACMRTFAHITAAAKSLVIESALPKGNAPLVSSSLLLGVTGLSYNYPVPIPGQVSMKASKKHTPRLVNESDVSGCGAITGKRALMLG